VPRRLALSLFGVSAVLVALVLAATAAGVLDGVEQDTIDGRFSVRGGHGAPAEIVIVRIDDVTFDALDLQWPFPRSVHAQLIDRLRAVGARVIAYDVQFTEQTDPGSDEALVLATGRAGNVVLATTEIGPGGGTGVFGGTPGQTIADVEVGHTLLAADSDGVVRRFDAEIDGLPAFALKTAEAFRPGSTDGIGESREWLDLAGGPGTVRAVSFSDVLEGRTDPAVLRGRIVIVGATAPSLHDEHRTSLSEGAPMSGAEVQANAISTTLRGFPLSRPGWLLDALLTVALALAAPLASLRLAPVRALLAATGAALAYLVAAQLLFGGGVIVAVAAPIVALGLCAVATLAQAFLAQGLERDRLRETFSRFVGRSVADDVLAGDAALGGVRREATVLFCDLRGFTALAETREPEAVIALLNTYLERMSDAILDHGGTLVSYLGDGVLAVFGAPVAQPDHAARALAAARAMLAASLPGELSLGIGISTGPVLSGRVGSERRMEYAAVGDTTNLAARLQELTRETGCAVLVSDATRHALGDAAGLTEVGRLDVRGRREGVVAWTLS
jgi:adenylate cyclase